MNNQFSSVFSVDDKTSPNVQGSQGDTMNEINITKEGITRLLSPSKASGPDMISARFVKETADEVAIGSKLIFQASLHQANIPDKWRKVIVIPIFKGGNKDCSKAENYRSISLTIHGNIISHLDQQRILTDVQHGFCKSRLCETQLIKTVNDLTKSLNEGQQVDSILLNFSKALDVVCH